MELAEPVTITRRDGSTETLTRLSLTFHDRNDHRVVTVALGRLGGGLVLWSGDEYDAIGDWTQAQAEARIVELLGDDLAAGLQAIIND